MSLATINFKNLIWGPFGVFNKKNIKYRKKHKLSVENILDLYYEYPIVDSALSYYSNAVKLICGACQCCLAAVQRSRRIARELSTRIVFAAARTHYNRLH